MNMSVKNEIIAAFTGVSAYIGAYLSDLNSWVTVGIGISTMIFTWSKAKNGLLDYRIKKHDFDKQLEKEAKEDEK